MLCGFKGYSRGFLIDSWVFQLPGSFIDVSGMFQNISAGFRGYQESSDFKGFQEVSWAFEEVSGFSRGYHARFRVIQGRSGVFQQVSRALQFFFQGV